MCRNCIIILNVFREEKEKIMLGILQFIQQVLSTPAIFVGLIALLGLLLQRQDPQTCIKGTIKTILGFIVLNAGAGVV